MGVVVKRDGRRQSFSPAKIRSSILKAAKDAKLPSAKAKILVKEVGDSVVNFYGHKPKVKSIMLARAIVTRLDRRSKKVSSAWRRYSASKRRAKD